MFNSPFPVNYPQLHGQNFSPLGQLGSQFGMDDWMLNQVDRMAIANGGYVRNPTAGTLPRLVGYPDSSWTFWNGMNMYG